MTVTRLHRLPTAARCAALVVACCMGLAGFGSAAHAQATPADALTRFTAWWSGEWNNNEQVWQHKIDAADTQRATKTDTAAHRHHIVVPVPMPQWGGQGVYVQQSQGDDLAQGQQRLLVRLRSSGGDSSIRQEHFSLPDRPELADAHLRPEALAALPSSELRHLAGCDLEWRFDATAQAYSGIAAPGQCSDDSAHPGLLQRAGSAQRLTAGQWSVDAARHRKVRYYQGWVWFKLAGPGAAADDKTTSFTAKYLLHNEGQRMAVMHQDGSASPYMLELALLTYQNTQKPVLKFALLDRQSLKTLSYVWSSADTPTLGLNLQWFQAGVSQKPERTAFGF